MEKEPKFNDITDEQFEEYIVKPYEHGKMIERAMQQAELVNCERVLPELTRKQLVELKQDAIEHYGSENNALVRLVADELSERPQDRDE